MPWGLWNTQVSQTASDLLQPIPGRSAWTLHSPPSPSQSCTWANACPAPWGRWEKIFCGPAVFWMETNYKYLAVWLKFPFISVPREKKAREMRVRFFFSEFLFKEISGSGCSYPCQLLSWSFCPVHSSLLLLMCWSYYSVIFSLKKRVSFILFLSLTHNIFLIRLWMNERVNDIECTLA